MDENEQYNEVFTGTHPKLTGKQIRHYRERLGYTLVEMAALLGYSSAHTRRLRERMYEFETEKKDLPAAQTRLLLAIAALAFAGTVEDPIDELLDHGNFFS